MGNKLDKKDCYSNNDLLYHGAVLLCRQAATALYQLSNSNRGLCFVDALSDLLQKTLVPVQNQKIIKK